MIALSYSRLKDYARCPFFFKCKHIDRIPSPENLILVSGSVIHKILCDYALKCYQRGLTHLYDEWEDIALTAINEHNIPMEQEQGILDAVKLYIEANEIQLEGLAGVEEKIAVREDFSLTKWDADDVFFRFVLDKLYIADDQAMISDYKTGFDIDPDPFQFECYAWAIYNLYPQVRFIEIELDFTRLAFKKTFPIGKEAMPLIDKRIRSRVRAVNAEVKWSPKANFSCNSCEFWSLCPLMRNQPIVRVPNTLQDAKQLLETAVMYEKNLDEVKNLLREFCKNNKEIVTNDIKAYFKPIKNTSYNVYSLLEWANKNNVNISNALTLDSRKLNRVIIPDEFKTVKISTRFSIEKQKENSLQEQD